MVSNYRCSEVKQEAIDLVKDDISKVRSQIEEEFDPNLKSSFSNILNKSIKLYEVNTDQYDEEIVRHKKTELELDLVRNFKDVSLIQEKKIQDIEIEKFKDVLERARSIDDFNKMASYCKQHKTEILERFQNQLNVATMVDDVAKSVDSFNDKVTQLMKDFFASRLNSLLKSIQNEKYKHFEYYLTRLFSDLKPTFWHDFLAEFKSTFDSYEDKIVSLRQGKPEVGQTNESRHRGDQTDDHG